MSGDMQVTRGRKAEWANTPLAQWIRQQLDGREKAWLISQIFQRNGGKFAAAEAAVNRWTYRGKPAHASQLQEASVGQLAAIFGQSPLDVVSDPSQLVEALRRLREAMEAALLLLPPQEPPATASGRRA